MNRRSFLRNGSLASFTLPALVTGSAQASIEDHNPAIEKDVDLNEATIEELQQKMQSGELSSKSITQWYLKRIGEIDKDGPKLNAVIEVNPDAEAIAETLD